MDTPTPGGEQRAFVGHSTGRPASMDEALQGVAEQIVRESQFVTKDTGPRWFRVTFMEVEIENQNVKTCRIGVTEI